MHVTFFYDKDGPVSEHDWVVDAIEYFGKNYLISLICTKESGISSIVQKKTDKINIYHFDKIEQVKNI